MVTIYGSVIRTAVNLMLDLLGVGLRIGYFSMAFDYDGLNSSTFDYTRFCCCCNLLATSRLVGVCLTISFGLLSSLTG